MATRAIIVSILTTLIISCNTALDRQQEEELREQITGEWERIIEKENSNEVPQPPPSSPSTQGMTIFNDSIEFYLGFLKGYKDSITGQHKVHFLGNNVPYKTNKNNIIIKSPLTGKWEFKWKFVRRQSDTLELSLNDTTFVRYKKLYYNLDTLPDFDQIIYSSSGCYGSCPILDISINKNGYVLFQGEGYVGSLGFYSARIDSTKRKIVFDKFRRANPLMLLDEYSFGGSDSESLTTTFIQNGKIVKTIRNYGRAGTNELKWAYIPISNLHNTIQLDKLPVDEPFYPKLHYFTFNKDGLILPLEKSESFYLWTELKKADQTNKQFEPKYRISFSGNYTYSGPNPNKERQHKYEIESIATDGQFYKFEFKDKMPITYDLGFNFVDRNFKSTDFRKPYKWEE